MGNRYFLKSLISGVEMHWRVAREKLMASLTIEGYIELEWLLAVGPHFPTSLDFAVYREECPDEPGPRNYRRIFSELVDMEGVQRHATPYELLFLRSKGLLSGEAGLYPLTGLGHALRREGVFLLLNGGNARVVSPDPFGNPPDSGGEPRNYLMVAGSKRGPRTSPRVLKTGYASVRNRRT